MDWENYSAIQRDQKQNQEDKENGPVDIDMTGEDHGPVAWRSIFVANELNELQTEMRKIEPATTLIWFTAFYIGLGWQWISKWNPDFNETENPLEPFNPILKFFLSSFMFAFIATVQMVIYYLVSMGSSPPSLEFTDLCTLANCSVLILTEPFGGYYIHGQAPWERSDLPLAWLKQQLDNEA